jgi:uncharacterized protein (DUF2236 family)
MVARSESPGLTGPDLERLRAALQRNRVDPRRSLYGPGSVTWRVNREAVLLLGGGRALLMQVAHPLVAAGVAAHSHFEQEPLTRLWRTLQLSLTTVFGDAASALRAVQTIERVHDRVHGRLAASAGPFKKGTPYNAHDPRLLFWVHATLVASALLVYEQFVAPLSGAERRTYYEESKIGARLFRIPARHIPRTLGDFEEYLAAMVNGDVLAVSADSRKIAASILSPPLPIGLRQAFQSASLFTIGLLPAPLRERYGFEWSPGRETVIRAVRTMTGTLLPFLPSIVRQMPHARRAAA